MPRLKRDSLKSYLRHSIEFVLNRVNERFHDSENETGCLVTLFDRVLNIPRASSLLRHIRDQNVPTYRFFLNHRLPKLTIQGVILCVFFFFLLLCER